MALKVAIQMDPIESIDFDGDSTFVLGLEAERRGYSLFHYLARDLSFRDGQVLARGRAMQLRAERGNHFTLGAPEFVDLAEMDVVLMRQDPQIGRAHV